jgi:hypothetical protein
MQNEMSNDEAKSGQAVSTGNLLGRNYLMVERRVAHRAKITEKQICA